MVGTLGDAGSYEHLGGDIIASVREETIGHEGMKIDRMLFEKFGDTVRQNKNHCRRRHGRAVGSRPRLRQPRGLRQA